MKCYRRLSASLELDLDNPGSNALTPDSEFCSVYFEDCGRLQREESCHLVGRRGKRSDKHSERDGIPTPVLLPGLQFSEDLVIEIDFDSSAELKQGKTSSRTGFKGNEFSLTDLYVHFDVSPEALDKSGARLVTLSEIFEVVLEWDRISAAEILQASIKRSCQRIQYVARLSTEEERARASSIIVLTYLSHQARLESSALKASQSVRSQPSADSDDNFPSPLEPTDSSWNAKRKESAISWTASWHEEAVEAHRGQGEINATELSSSAEAKLDSEITDGGYWSPTYVKALGNAHSKPAQDAQRVQFDSEEPRRLDEMPSMEYAHGKEVSVRPMLILELDMNYKEIMPVKEYFISMLQKELANCLDLKPEEVRTQRSAETFQFD
eukprot:764490-Hanusia_phi.AAC.5